MILSDMPIIAKYSTALRVLPLLLSMVACTDTDIVLRSLGGPQSGGTGAPPRREVTATRPDLDMVRISAGQFLMSHRTIGSPDTLSPRPVFLSTYRISHNLTTWEDFYRFILSADRRDRLRYGRTAGDLQDNATGERWNQPVYGVTWDAAEAFAVWMDGRLPTEAELEKAGRSDFGRRYMLDASWEWARDWYRADYWQSAPLANPAGPDDSFPANTKVIRRAHVGTDGAVFTRSRESPTPLRSTIGFRIVRAGN